jgi:hypothetical protein
MTIVAIAPTAIPWSRRFGESPFKNGAKNEGTCIAVSFSPDMFRREFTGHPDGFLSASWIESPNALRWRFGRFDAGPLSGKSPEKSDLKATRSFMRLNASMLFGPARSLGIARSKGL